MAKTWRSGSIVTLAISIITLALVAGSAVATADSPTPRHTGTPLQEEPAPGEMTEGKFVAADGTTRPIYGRAKLFRGQRGRTKLSVSAGGLQPDTGYPTYLHVGSCADHEPPYMQDPAGPPEPPNQLWASSDPADPKGALRSDAQGRAKGVGTAAWLARPEARSVVLHSPEEGNPALACADLG